ncbi:hypothetical protein MLD38_005481 [Melastoma candidum]|uniref:Uncharacterized protein n=1 Tax=Melastoma candidum TaxID=119954 RepID=A0ACB9RKA8_9MYRT|nr:hypothetical protein MLD38_005481 [Melastoma candidum]
MFLWTNENRVPCFGTLALGMEFCNSGDGSDLRRGPWTREEDNLLTRYIICHGEGRWNLLAKRAGLKRNGKSCRLRWLNYLKPDIKRGNLTAEEQLLILNLHHKWGNRWSKIAQYLPGRTDNEIKNYWRSRVKNQAQHQFKQQAADGHWIPRLFPMTTEQDPTLQQIRAAITTTQNLADATVLSSYSTISTDSSSIGLTRSSSKGNNFPGNGIDQNEFRNRSDGNNPPDQQDSGECYFDDFDVGCYYNAEELSALRSSSSTSECQADGVAKGFWGADVDYDIWQLRNSDNLGF